jgi:hypothetical protein
MMKKILKTPIRRTTDAASGTVPDAPDHDAVGDAHEHLADLPDDDRHGQEQRLRAPP